MTELMQFSCSDRKVNALLRFVASREAEHPLAELQEAHAVCSPGTPCVLSTLELLSLTLVAVRHDQHPDFDPVWLHRIAALMIEVDRPA